MEEDKQQTYKERVLVMQKAYKIEKAKWDEEHPPEEEAADDEGGAAAAAGGDDEDAPMAASSSAAASSEKKKKKKEKKAKVCRHNESAQRISFESAPLYADRSGADSLFACMVLCE